MTNLIPTKAVVSALLIKRFDEGNVRLLLQTRWKPKISPTYSGMIEIPAGTIEPYENIYDSLRREVKEETNLDIIRVLENYQGDMCSTRQGDRSFAFRPFVCQQAIETNNGLPWIGFVFLCETRGDATLNTSEAKDPRWVSIDELATILAKEPEKIFPLQLPVLEYFLEFARTSNFKL
ncbi:MAG TPA: NUDIX domain-containing protein [Candidatus Paceibacterota bacterium]